jgi:peptide/nickel transport system substrate-binding protein
VRQAASLAIDLKNINQAITLGHSKVTGNAFVPSHFEFFWRPPEPPVFDPAKAKRLLAEAGHPNGIDAGPFYVDAPFSDTAEAIVNSLREGGIRANVRPLERAAFYKSYADKKLKGLIMGGSAAFGNAATRLEAFVVKDGTYAYGSYPDIDELFQKQAVDLDREKRAALLDRIQRLVLDKMIAAPVFHLSALSGVGPRVGESGIGLIGGNPWSSPYEDVTLKGA